MTNPDSLTQDELALEIVAPEDQVFEACGICEGECGDEYGPCVECNGVGLIPHDCA